MGRKLDHYGALLASIVVFVDTLFFVVTGATLFAVIAIPFLFLMWYLLIRGYVDE